MSKTEYDLKTIMYSAYDTPHKLCNISGIWTIRQPRSPPNNADRPMRQFKCPLAWFKWRADSPPVRFCLLLAKISLKFCKYVRLTVCYLPKFSILASMFVWRFVCLSVCVFVCLSVRKFFDTGHSFWYIFTKLDPSMYLCHVTMPIVFLGQRSNN